MKEQEGEREKEGGNLDILLHVVHLSPRLNHTGSIRSILLDTALFCNPLFVIFLMSREIVTKPAKMCIGDIFLCL